MLVELDDKCTINILLENHSKGSEKSLFKVGNKKGVLNGRGMSDY